MYDYDFDPDDRPCVYQHESYAKWMYPPNKSFDYLYGNHWEPDWTNATCTSFIGECENKKKKALYQVKW